MLRTNLATRPFYNERAVHIFLSILGLVAGAVLVNGGLSLTELFLEHTVLTAEAMRDEQQASEILGETVVLQRNAGGAEFELLVAAGREANQLINRRAFSWTEFFNRIERMVPNGVVLTSLRPEIDADVTTVSIGMIGRNVEAIDRFIEQLEGTGAFADVLSREEEIMDDGTYRAVLFGRYISRPIEMSDSGIDSVISVEATQ